MTMTATSNGPVRRKQLSDQLDRLDGIIDALADGLNQAVADAARDGSRAAVQEVLIELVSNPQVGAFLQTASGHPQSPAHHAGPSFFARMKGRICGAVRKVVGFVSRNASAASQAITNVVRRVVFASQRALHLVVVKARRLAAFRSFKIALFAAIGICAIVAISFQGSMGLFLSAVAAATAAGAIQIGKWFRRAVSRLRLA